MLRFILQDIGHTCRRLFRLLPFLLLQGFAHGGNRLGRIPRVGAGGEARIIDLIRRTTGIEALSTSSLVKDALHDGFGVEPARVVQSSYEPIQYD